MSKLRTLRCKEVLQGDCQQKEKHMTRIENTFKKQEKFALGVINAYIHKGNDPSGQTLPHDKRGYSALHLAAERNLLHVAETLLESGFDPLTPGCEEHATGNLALQVAIEMGFDEMAALIIKHMEPADVRDLFRNKPKNSEFMSCKQRGKINGKKVDVLSVKHLIQRKCVFVKTIQAVFDSLKDVNGNRLCTVYVQLLEEDDSGFEPTDEGFNVHHRTVFHNLTYGQKEVANHPVIGKLIDYKWKAWGRRKFVIAFVFYVLSLFSLTFAIASGALADDVNKYDTSIQRARAFFEIFVCIIAICRLVIEVLQKKWHMLEYWKQFFNWIELLSSACILIVVLLRYTTEKAHWFMLAIAYMLWVLRIFKYAAVSSHTGAYAESLRQILTNNFVPFSLLFIVVNLAFGGVFLLVLKGEDRLSTHLETSTIYGIWFVGLRTMIEAGPIVEYTGPDGYGPASTIVMLVFMTTTIVVLLNILIAQLSDTYSKIQGDAEKSFRANRLAILTRLERNEWQFLTYLQKQSNRKKHYKPEFANVDLSKYKLISTPNEDIHESVREYSRAQLKTDLRTQTIKSRLRKLDEEMMKKFQDIKDVLDTMNADVQQIRKRNNPYTKNAPGLEMKVMTHAKVYHAQNGLETEI